METKIRDVVKQKKLILVIIVCILIVVIGIRYYNKNLSSEGILENVTNRNGYMLNRTEKPISVKLFIQPEWIPFDSEQKVQLNEKMTQLHNTTILLDNVINRGNDIYFSFDTSYHLNYEQGEFLYNGIFNEDGSFTSSFGIDALVIYNKNNKEIDVGQKGTGPGCAFSFGLNPEHYEDIKDGFYVEYNDLYLFDYARSKS